MGASASKAANALRKLSGATVTLEAATAAARDLGEIDASERLVVRIRRVRSSEVIAQTGTTPLLFGLARERQAGESQDEFNARIQARLMDDPALVQDAQRQTLAMQDAVVRLGVTHFGIAGDAEPELDPVSDIGLDTVDLLGADLERVYNAICDASSLPYQRAEVAAHTTSFPPEQPGDPDQ